MFLRRARSIGTFLFPSIPHIWHPVNEVRSFSGPIENGVLIYGLAISHGGQLCEDWESNRIFFWKIFSHFLRKVMEESDL